MCMFYFGRCSFYLHPCEGSSVQILTQGKLSAPRILRIHKVNQPMLYDNFINKINVWYCLLYSFMALFH